MLSLFCFGFGYTAKYFATGLNKSEWTVSGTTRTPSGAHYLNELKYKGFIFGGQSAGNVPTDYIYKATHILISIPPEEFGDPTLRYHSESIKNSEVQWIGYLSTIGVYGDHSGGWVDEETPVRPKSERSRRRVLAEKSWLDFGKENHKRVEVFRLSGIYGPRRNILDSLRNNTLTTIVKKNQVFNRIHVEDIARTLISSLSSSQKSSIYNVTDDEPASPQEVHAFAAKLLGVPSPPEIPIENAQLSEMARSFYSENKRVRNERIKNELGVKLAFPTYREGLTDLENNKRNF